MSLCVASLHNRDRIRNRNSRTPVTLNMGDPEQQAQVVAYPALGKPAVPL